MIDHRRQRHKHNGTAVGCSGGFDKEIHGELPLHLPRIFDWLDSEAFSEQAEALRRL